MNGLSLCPSLIFSSSVSISPSFSYLTLNLYRQRCRNLLPSLYCAMRDDWTVVTDSTVPATVSLWRLPYPFPRLPYPSGGYRIPLLDYRTPPFIVLFVSGVDWRSFSFVSSQFFRLFLFFGAKVVDKLGVRRFIRKELREEGRKEEKWVSVAAIHDLWREEEEEEEEEDGRLKWPFPLLWSTPSIQPRWNTLIYDSRERAKVWMALHTP